MAPKILFSRSIGVDSLLDSGAANYFEFCSVGDTYFLKQENPTLDDFVKIPFSKSEIFTNTVLSFKEKRQLVKIIEYCLKAADMDESTRKVS